MAIFVSPKGLNLCHRSHGFHSFVEGFMSIKIIHLAYPTTVEVEKFSTMYYIFIKWLYCLALGPEPLTQEP